MKEQVKYTTLVKEFKGPMYIYNEIKNGNISIEKNEEDRKEFKSKLNEITTKKIQIINQKINQIQ